MGMLDTGIASLFAEAFSALYLDGTLHSGQANPIYSTGGTITGYTNADDVPIKLQLDAVDWAMRQDVGFAEGDAKVIILNTGGIVVSTDNEITDHQGKRWKIETVSVDPAGSHYVCRGRPA